MFNPATRRTHAITEAAVAILEVLEHREAPTALEIHEELFGADAEADEAAMQSIEAALTALAGEQLIVVLNT